LGALLFIAISAQALQLPSPRAGWRTGVYAVDADDGTVVADMRSDQLFRPASTVKLVTTLLALETLGPDFVYETAIEADTSSGTVYLVGAGSPLLEEDDIRRAAVETAGSLDPGRQWLVAWDSGCFEDSTHPPGWERADWGRTYCPPIEALSFGGNLVEVVVSSVGGRVRVMEYPGLPGVPVTSSVGIGNGSIASSITGWEDGQGSISISGSIPAGSTRSLWLPIPGASAEFAMLFAGDLGDLGLEVSGVIRQEAPSDPGLLTASVIRSRPLWQILGEMNKWSINGIAELVLRAVSLEACGEPAGTAAGCQMAGELILDLVPGAGDMVLADGSGLSRLDRLSPRVLAEVVVAGMSSTEWGPEFLASLPVNGVDGTLETRLADLPPGSFRGKTGSLSDTSTLAGLLTTSSGRRIAVAVMTEVPAGQVFAARAWQDDLVRAIYAAL